MMLTEPAAERYVAATCFATGPAGFIGATVELQPGGCGPAPAGPGFRRLRHGHLTGDYGGMLVVSSPPSPGVDVAVRRTAQDVALARDLLARELPAGDVPAGDVPVAGVRVCVDAGTDEVDLRRRWAAAHAVGPVLAAVFANSPQPAGPCAGWRSSRTASLLPLQRPVAGGDPRAAWTAYVLDSPTASGATFRSLLRGPHRVGVADLRRHLDTLPAPVRARGHLELTIVDVPPGDGWQVAVAVAAVLVDDARAAEQALAATAGLPADAWTRAARDGLTDAGLARAARHCFTIAYAALARQGTARALRDAVADYADTHVCRARCPADQAPPAARPGVAS